jgi:hypothetical protein
MRMRFFLPLAALLAVPSPGRGHPVSYKGAVGLMSWNQPDMTDWMTTYTFHRHFAAAGHYMRVMTEDGELRAGVASLNTLLKRWNGLDYQGNVYFSAGGGHASREGKRGPASYASLQADHESRRHIVLAEGSMLMADEGPAVWHWEARAGVSRFDEVSSWFILAVHGTPQAEHDVGVTPMIRVFYRNVLGEVGAGTNGDWMLNFMVHF